MSQTAQEKAAKKRKRTVAIAALVVLVCAAFAILLPTVIVPNQKYKAAVELYRAGKYEDAIAAFTALDGYRDSAAQIEKCETAIKDEAYAAAAALMNAGKYQDAYEAFLSMDYKDSSEKASECLFLKQRSGLTNLTVGSVIKFGFYEQDNDPANGKEEIEWIVLDADGGKALLISQYALDCQPFSTSNADATWEKCTLRTWLNETFCEEAFSAFHQDMILRSTVTADMNPVFDTPPGNETTDKLFLISTPELHQYFSSKSACECRGTAYCYAQGAYKAKNGNCYWWLRTPGMNPVAVSFVRYEGTCVNLGYLVSLDYFAVRPAVWIDLGD